MDPIENILTRRSIRKFIPQALIPQEKIDLIIKAAMQAPTARNKQPWHFVVVNERSVLDKIAMAHPYAGMLKEASFALIVCGDTDLDDTIEYIIMDCAAATQNALLAAHAQELGGVWLGIYPRKERMTALTDLLKLPQNVIPMTAIAFGIPNETKSFDNRFKPERLHYNKW